MKWVYKCNNYGTELVVIFKGLSQNTFCCCELVEAVDTPGFQEKKKKKIRKLLQCQIEFTGFKQTILLKLNVVITWLLQMVITSGYYLDGKYRKILKWRYCLFLKSYLKKSLKKEYKICPIMKGFHSMNVSSSK